MELKLPIWTATQSNREGFNEDVITIDKVGEAINKAHGSRFLWYIFTKQSFILVKIEWVKPMLIIILICNQKS